MSASDITSWLSVPVALTVLGYSVLLQKLVYGSLRRAGAIIVRAAEPRYRAIMLGLICPEGNLLCHIGDLAGLIITLASAFVAVA